MRSISLSYEVANIFLQRFRSARNVSGCRSKRNVAAFLVTSTPPWRYYRSWAPCLSCCAIFPFLAISISTTRGTVMLYNHSSLVLFVVILNGNRAILTERLLVGCHVRKEQVCLEYRQRVADFACFGDAKSILCVWWRWSDVRASDSPSPKYITIYPR